MGMMNRSALKGWKPGDRCKPKTACAITGGAKQEFREESDINVIIGRFVRDGRAVPVSAVQPIFADVSAIPSFQELHDRMEAGREAFNALEPKVRARFHNDPVELIEFIQDESNRDEAVRLGLVSAKPVVSPASSPAVSAAGAGATLPAA